MNVQEEHFSIGEKIIFVYPEGSYSDIFSMTGNIMNIDHSKRLYFVKLDDPSLLKFPEKWKTPDGCIPMGFDTVISVNEIYEEEYIWFNKGKTLLEDSYTFDGLINTIDVIIESLNGDYSNVALQTLGELDVSWLADKGIDEVFLCIKELFADQLISIEVATEKLSEFRKLINHKYMMLN